MALFNDGVFSFEKMQHLDPVLEDDITGESINLYVDADIRNRLAHLELTHYNNHGEFIYKHPITKNKKVMDELDRLRKYNPEEFTRQMISAADNIKRYRSYLNKKTSPSNKERYTELLLQHENKYAIMQKVISR